MILFKEAAALKEFLEKQREKNKTVGFVPTMGALHAGHISLIALCKTKSDITVCSIFINPTQFNDAKDFEKYPVTINNDILFLENHKCDVLFLPSVNEMYPDGTKLERLYDLGEVENLLEGKYRAGHFQGVCQVVHRLLNIISPDFIFLGQKDYQQVIVLKRLVELIGSKAQVVTAQTLREESGLAMSSRNLRLSNQQKEDAIAIFKMLNYIKDNYRSSAPANLQQHVSSYLLDHGFNKVDYVTIADADTLKPSEANTSHDQVALIAATIGDVRLIDNMILTN